MKRGKITAVIGGQYGSEGKGVIVAKIAHDYDTHIRVGSPNAGHTFWYGDKKQVMQSIPCGWINPKADIIIGRGALINMDLLISEIANIETYFPDFKKRLYIDEMAGILDEKYHQEEGGVNGEMHKRMGSTGEGVGAARIGRIRRDGGFRFFKDIVSEYPYLRNCMVENTPALIAEQQNHGINILLEGTQGAMLSMLHGFYPYTTSIDTNAAQICAEIGIAPSRLTDIILVCRTYPIRVAGNSGYMKNEISWEELSKRTGKNLTERTTVTKKTRRVAEWDIDIVKQACILNAPTEIALTFADYIDPYVEGLDDFETIFSSEIVFDMVRSIEVETGVSVTMIGTGGKMFAVGRRCLWD